MNIFRILTQDAKIRFLILMMSIEIVFTFIFYPGFKMVSVSPHKINLSPSLAPVCGTILGPFYGAIAIVTAKSVYLSINPKAAYFGVFTVLPITLGTIVAGYLSEGRWKHAAIVIAFGLLLWYSTEVGRVVYYYPFLPIFALILILHLKDKICKLMFKKNTIKSIFGTATLSFCSVTTDHIYGSFLGILYLDIPTHMYAEVIPNFVEERLFMVLIGTVFTTMVIYLTKKILEYAPKIYDKMLEKYIDEYMQDKNDCNEVDLELLKKLGLSQAYSNIMI